MTKDGTAMTGQNDQVSKMALLCFGVSVNCDTAKASKSNKRSFEN